MDRCGDERAVSLPPGLGAEGSSPAPVRPGGSAWYAGRFGSLGRSRRPRKPAMQSQADTETAPRAQRRLAAWLLVLLPFGLFLSAGWRGLDFGEHWDQQHRVADLAHSFQEQTFLPEDYFYPSVTFYTTLLVAAPKATEFADADRDTEEFRGEFLRMLHTNEFQVRLRSVFLLLTSLSIVWVFVTMLAWRKRFGEGLVAAFLLAGSFEVGYHARWVAPDALLMQFGALCLLTCVGALRVERGRGWLRAAAIAAGLAAGTKYTGGIFLLPVLLVAASQVQRVRSVAYVTLLFGLTFVVTTPGVLIEPTKFVADVLYEMRHYQEGHYGFSIEPGAAHFAKNLQYLVLYGPSHWPALSLVIGAFGALGVVATWRESKLLAAVLLVVPLVFVPYLSLQKVMFVRNLLLVLPIGALFAARGVGRAWELLPSLPLRATLAAAVGAVFATNLGFAYYAADTIVKDDPEWLAGQLQGYLESHDDRVVQLSPNVRTLLLQYGLDVPEHVRRFPSDDTEAVMLFPREVRTLGYWPSNDPGLKDTIGPLSTNYDYYATWWTEHVIVIDRDALHELAAMLPIEGVDLIFPDLVPGRNAPPEDGNGKAAGKTSEAD